MGVRPALAALLGEGIRQKRHMALRPTAGCGRPRPARQAFRPWPISGLDAADLQLLDRFVHPPGGRPQQARVATTLMMRACSARRRPSSRSGKQKPVRSLGSGMADSMVPARVSAAASGSRCDGRPTRGSAHRKRLAPGVGLSDPNASATVSYHGSQQIRIPGLNPPRWPGGRICIAGYGHRLVLLRS